MKILKMKINHLQNDGLYVLTQARRGCVWGSVFILENQFGVHHRSSHTFDAVQRMSR